MSKEQNSQNVINFIKRRKSNLIKVFHSECCICKFNAFQEALEFHHVYPEQKSFGITASNSVTKALEKQLEEMKKCILVCANCHRGIHAGYILIPENFQDFYDKKLPSSYWTIQGKLKDERCIIVNDVEKKSLQKQQISVQNVYG